MVETYFFCRVSSPPPQLLSLENPCSDYFQIICTCGIPSKMKHAIVTHLLKKPTLNSDELKNYRPVSNLSFVSKLTEKVVAARLIAHLKRSNLQEPLQSAYSYRHITGMSRAAYWSSCHWSYSEIP